MPRPKKPAKTAKNRLPVFREAIASHMPAAFPFSRSSRARGSQTVILWAAVTVIAGMLLGRLLAGMNTGSSLVPAPNPLATASLSVVPAATQTGLTVSSVASVEDLTVQNASAITQATGGTPYVTEPGTQLQPASGAASLKPWTTYQAVLQGTVGTAAVE